MNKERRKEIERAKELLSQASDILEQAEADELPWLFYLRILCGEVHFFTGHSGAGKSPTSPTQ